MTSQEPVAEHRPIFRLLETFPCLETDDFHLLEELLAPGAGARAKTRLIDEGNAVDAISVLEQGWAIRFKTLQDGRRQILNFLLPGDIFGLFGSLFERTEFGVETLTPVALSTFSFSRMLDTFRQAPRLALALSWLAGQDERQLDEQIVRIGRRNATERMAHLFMELHWRLAQAGIGGDAGGHLPLTQSLLADTLGMSHVHANRNFRGLVSAGLVELRHAGVQILNPAALAEIAEFDAAYLEEVQVPQQTRQAFPE